MALWKRGGQYSMDSVVGGQRCREPLQTMDWREAKELEKQRLAELARRPGDPERKGRSYDALDVSKADVARNMRQGYVTVHVTVGRSEEGDPRERLGIWLAALDDFRNWLRLGAERVLQERKEKRPLKM